MSPLMNLVGWAVTLAGGFLSVYLLVKKDREPKVAALFVLGTLLLIGFKAHEEGLDILQSVKEERPPKPAISVNIDTTVRERPLGNPSSQSSVGVCREMEGPLQLWVDSASEGSRVATVNGVDALRPNTPFTWFWGDGTSSIGWLPQTHQYPWQQSYTVTVISRENNGSSHCAQVKIF